MAEKRVIIGNPAGEEYSVTPAAFRKLYEPRGFTMLRNEDGSPLKDQQTSTEPSMTEVRARARAAGVSAGGSKAAILARIADAEKVPETPAPAGEATGPES